MFLSYLYIKFLFGIWNLNFQLSNFIKTKNWSSCNIFLIKSFLCHSKFTRLLLNRFYSGFLYFFNQRNPNLMPKCCWRRYWWEKVADAVVQKMNEWIKWRKIFEEYFYSPVDGGQNTGIECTTLLTPNIS